MNFFKKNIITANGGVVVVAKVAFACKKYFQVFAYFVGKCYICIM